MNEKTTKQPGATPVTLYPPLTANNITLLQNIIKQGKLVVLPTDTVYGVGTNPFDKDAVRGLLQAKGRGENVPSPVLVANIAQAEKVTSYIPEEARKLMHAFWPGALTIILPANEQLELNVGNTYGTVGIRIPAESTTINILEQTGPLAVTSANTHGNPAATKCAEARKYFGEKVSIYVDGGERKSAIPSTIIKFEVNGAYTILREGAIAPEKIIALIEQ